MACFQKNRYSGKGRISRTASLLLCLLLAFPVWGIADTENLTDWGNRVMGLNLAREAAEAGADDFGRPMLIAVIDTGCDTEHECFAGRISPQSKSFMPGFEGLSGNNRHGTFVAGILAAATPASTQLLILKVGDGNDFAPDDQFEAAILYALEQGADLINMSIQVASETPVTQDFRSWGSAIGKCRDAGVPLFCGAGNSARDTCYYYPAGDERIIAVSAMTASGGRNESSNFGAGIKFCGPGKDIRVPAAGTKDEYTYSDGTSLASPFVAAAASYLLAAHPDYSVDELCEALAACATDLGDPGRDIQYGYGLPVISRVVTGKEGEESLPVFRKTARVLSAVRGENEHEGAENLFSGITGKWCVPIHNGAFVEWEEETPIQPAFLHLMTANDNADYPGRNPRNAKLFARTEKTAEWELIWEQPENGIMPDANYQSCYFSISDAKKAARYFRLYIPETTGSDILQLAVVELGTN